MVEIHASQTSMCTEIKYVGSGSIGLGLGLRFCISVKLPGSVVCWSPVHTLSSEAMKYNADSKINVVLLIALS